MPRLDHDIVVEAEQHEMLDAVALQQDEAALAVERQDFVDGEAALAARRGEPAAEAEALGDPGEREDQRDDEEQRADEMPIRSSSITIIVRFAGAASARA